ncbi:MAG: hemolysin III family protein [Amaricoccus sp.]
MFTRERVPMVYSRAELMSDAAVHLTGIVAALLAVPVLITLAAVWIGDASTVAAALVYGLCLIAMLACSAVNNMVHRPHWKDRLRRIDQSAIYLKIAGSYTPFAVLTGTHAGLFLTGVWGAALAGAVIRLVSAARLKWASIILYLLIGWAGALAGGPLFAQLTTTGFALIVIAGGIYTAGVIFFVWERLPFHNTIWHVFVLAATFVLYAAVLVEISRHAA